MHFQETPWDLYLTVGYTTILSAWLLLSGLSNFLAVLLVLFVPGYNVAAAIFPANSEIDWIERIALSLGLSIAIVPLVALPMNFTPWGIRLGSVVPAVSLFTVSAGSVAYMRRMQLQPSERLAATLSVGLPAWKDYNILDKTLTIGLVVAVAAATGTLAFVVAIPHSGEGFTEFYILGPTGNASGYPTRLNVSENGTVILGIVNHQSTTVNYTVRVDLVGMNVVFNTKCNCDETKEANRTSLAWLNRSLGDNENWTRRYTFSINAIGLWKLEFLLYKDTMLTPEMLHFFTRVS